MAMRFIMVDKFYLFNLFLVVIICIWVGFWKTKKNKNPEKITRIISFDFLCGDGKRAG